MSQAEQDRRIDYVEFGATDVEATKGFYSAVFGWEFTDYGPDYTSFADGRLSGGFGGFPVRPALRLDGPVHGGAAAGGG